MEPFCIDRSIIGTEKHLIVDNGFSWVDLVPSTVWHLSGKIKPKDDRCFDSLLKLSRKKIDIDPPQRFVTAMTSLLSGSVHYPPPWQRVLPVAEHRTFVKNLVESVSNILPHCCIDYFDSTWVPGNHVLNSLQPASVDVEAWHKVVESGLGNIPAVLSLAPGVDGVCGEVSYDRFGTRTGRMTIASGPQILTLKKEHRGLLRSRHGAEGTILMLDFSAMEARVVLYEAGRRCEALDMYSALGDELRLDRTVVKAIVISEMYGSSKKALRDRLELPDATLDQAMSLVKQHFNVSELRARLKVQFTQTGTIINKYGRPVLIEEPLDHIIFNSYVQSSGADVVMLGFKEIIAELGEKATPIFLIHDAMLLDVHNDHVADVKSSLVKVNGYVQRFPVSLSTVHVQDQNK